MYYWGDKAKNAPEEPGVYALYDKNGILIYVGKSTNLRKEFASYLETGFSEDPCKRETKYYKRELTLRQEEKMNELLEEYRQEHNELPKCNSHIEPRREKVARETAFHFYEDIGKPLNEVAFDLQDLREKITKVPTASLEFHQKRGDFGRWIKEALKSPQLAEAIRKVSESGEDLKMALLKELNGSEKATCPECGAETTPVKTWKMAGRPSKTGERLQLTIGHYKCPKCNKTFRRVLAKEKIRAS
jgi:hypothetical protein